MNSTHPPRPFVRPDVRVDFSGRGLRKALLETLARNPGYHAVTDLAQGLALPAWMVPNAVGVLDALASDLRILRGRNGLFAARPPRRAGISRDSADDLEGFGP